MAGHDGNLKRNSVVLLTKDCMHGNNLQLDKKGQPFLSSFLFCLMVISFPLSTRFDLLFSLLHCESGVFSHKSTKSDFYQRFHFKCVILMLTLNVNGLQNSKLLLMSS